MDDISAQEQAVAVLKKTMESQNVTDEKKNEAIHSISNCHGRTELDLNAFGSDPTPCSLASTLALLWTTGNRQDFNHLGARKRYLWVQKPKRAFFDGSNVFRMDGWMANTD